MRARASVVARHRLIRPRISTLKPATDNAADATKSSIKYYSTGQPCQQVLRAKVCIHCVYLIIVLTNRDITAGGRGFHSIIYVVMSRNFDYVYKVFCIVS